MKKGFLILETGDVFEGTLFGKVEEAVGEVVFNTSMTGYQEIISDPSYAGQIVTFCYPIIGNYGINLFDNESMTPKLAGIVVGDLCLSPSHFLSVQTLAEQMEEAGIIGITGIDTRALTKVIRTTGTVKGIITDRHTEITQFKIYDFWSKLPILPPGYWVEDVSTKKVEVYENNGPHIALIDYGYKKSILNALLKQGCKVTIVPYTYSYEQVKSLQPDGVLFSNGPGDPSELQPFFLNIKRISESFPSLGICLGHQLIALANGAKTEKLKFGHRGGNHPVKELQTGKVWMTSQNHGYVVVEESIDPQLFQITYRNVNDRSIEGMKHRYLPIQSVQFHPEAHAGPSDTEYIIEAFIHQLIDLGVNNYAFT